MLTTLHYGSGNGFPNTGDNNVTYVDYTPLTNMSTTERLTESKSPMTQMTGNGTGNEQSSYSFFENIDTGNSNGGYGNNYGQSSSTAKSATNYEYSIQTPSARQVEYDSGGNSDQPLQLLIPMSRRNSNSVTIGPGTVQQRTLSVIYDPLLKDSYGVYLNIVEQPTNRIRYRYRSEKGSHGGLNGETSSQMKKTYPTIKVENYRHSSPVYIRASLATNEDQPKAHVHKLMGRHCSEDGACTLPMNDNMTTTFQNLGILFIGKKEVPEILYKRKLVEYQTRYYTNTITDKIRTTLREQSEKEAKDMNLNSVKICFEAFMLQDNALYPICAPVFSRPIANQKSPDSGELKIIRINRYYGSVSGGEEMYLLCEKVNKKEIRVRFFEVDTEGNQRWEAFGSFTESDVHHQVAIVFRTPPYRDQNIAKPAQVYLQLYRQRDGEFSEPRTFIYKPKSSTDLCDLNSDTLSIKSGLQECVLSRIKLENQPPGYKRRKYSHQQARVGKPNGVSSTNRGATCSTNNSNTVGNSYLQRKNGNAKQQQQVKASNSHEVVIKTESLDDLGSFPVDSSTTNNSNVHNVSTSRSYTLPIEVTFCTDIKSEQQPTSGDNTYLVNGCKSTSSQQLSAPNNRSVSLSSSLTSLASPNSLSTTSSVSSPPSAATSPSSSATSLMLANALQHTVTLECNQTHADSIDFDHLDSMWTPPSEPSPPLVVSEYYHNFMPMQSANTSTQSTISGDGLTHSTSFVNLDLGQNHSTEQAKHANQQQAQLNSTCLLEQQLPIVPLEVVTSISLSSSLSIPSSPSLSSSSSPCTSSITSSVSKFGSNQTLCMHSYS